MNHNQQYVPVDRTVATDHLPFFERADSDNAKSVVPGTFVHTAYYGRLFVINPVDDLYRGVDSVGLFVDAESIFEHFEHGGVDAEGLIMGFNTKDVIR